MFKYTGRHNYKGILKGYNLVLKKRECTGMVDCIKFLTTFDGDESISTRKTQLTSSK